MTALRLFATRQSVLGNCPHCQLFILKLNKGVTSKCQMLMLILVTCCTTFFCMSMLKSDMLNNFCFHVSAQKWVFVIMSHVTCRMSHVTWIMSSAYVDPWDMLDNFCFHVYAQKWVFVIKSHVTCHIAYVTCHMSNADVDPWDMLNNFCFHVSAQKWIWLLVWNNHLKLFKLWLCLRSLQWW